MAMSFRVFPSFTAGETASFVKLSSTTVRLVPANIRTGRTMTIAAASKPGTETKKRAPSGISKPRRVSAEMREFLGGLSEIARTQALREIWAYIKEHNLQDPSDKKVIVCDEKLKTIFKGRDRVGFLEIAGLITPHFLKFIAFGKVSAAS